MDKPRKSAFSQSSQNDLSMCVAPPTNYSTPYVTGGLQQLHQRIELSRNGKQPDNEGSANNIYTDGDGSFQPKLGMIALAGRYQFVETIGKGQSSVLIKAKDLFQGEKLVSIKVLNRYYSLNGHGIQEMDCLRRLNQADPFCTSSVVRLCTAFWWTVHCCLVFELLHPTPLRGYFSTTEPKSLALQQTRKVAVQLLLGLGFLQQENVIHADLKPENILLKHDGDFSSLKVLDFGNAIHCIYDELSLYYDDFEIQTPRYRAPEVVFGVPFGMEIDMWSLGCILAELFTGSPLFPSKNRTSHIKIMTEKLGPLPWELFQRGKFFKKYSHLTVQNPRPRDVPTMLLATLKCTDHSFADLLAGLLKYNPAERLTVSEAAMHPFLAPELALRYLLPAKPGGGKMAYPRVLLDEQSYKSKPHVDGEISKKHLSSIDLLREGSCVSQGSYIPSLTPIAPTTRKVAQVIPLNRETPSEQLNGNINHFQADQRVVSYRQDVASPPTTNGNQRSPPQLIHEQVPTQTQASLMQRRNRRLENRMSNQFRDTQQQSGLSEQSSSQGQLSSEHRAFKCSACRNSVLQKTGSCSVHRDCDAQQTDSRDVHRASAMQQTDSRDVRRASAMQQTDRSDVRRASAMQQADRRDVHRASAMQQTDRRDVHRALAMQQTDSRDVNRASAMQQTDIHVVSRGSAMQQTDSRDVRRASAVQQTDSLDVHRASSMHQTDSRDVVRLHTSRNNNPTNNLNRLKNETPDFSARPIQSLRKSQATNQTQGSKDVHRISHRQSSAHRNAQRSDDQQRRRKSKDKNLQSSQQSSGLMESTHQVGSGVRSGQQSVQANNDAAPKHSHPTKESRQEAKTEIKTEQLSPRSESKANILAKQNQLKDIMREIREEQSRIEQEEEGFETSPVALLELSSPESRPGVTEPIPPHSILISPYKSEHEDNPGYSLSLTGADYTIVDQAEEGRLCFEKSTRRASKDHLRHNHGCEVKPTSSLLKSDSLGHSQLVHRDPVSVVSKRSRYSSQSSGVSFTSADESSDSVSTIKDETFTVCAFTGSDRANNNLPHAKDMHSDNKSTLSQTKPLSPSSPAVSLQGHKIRRKLNKGMLSLSSSRLHLSSESTDHDHYSEEDSEVGDDELTPKKGTTKTPQSSEDRLSSDWVPSGCPSRKWKNTSTDHYTFSDDDHDGAVVILSESAKDSRRFGRKNDNKHSLHSLSSSSSENLSQCNKGSHLQVFKTLKSSQSGTNEGDTKRPQSKRLTPQNRTTSREISTQCSGYSLTPLSSALPTADIHLSQSAWTEKRRSPAVPKALDSITQKPAPCGTPCKKVFNSERATTFDEEAILSDRSDSPPSNRNLSYQNSAYKQHDKEIPHNNRKQSNAQRRLDDRVPSKRCTKKARYDLMPQDNYRQSEHGNSKGQTRSPQATRKHVVLTPRVKRFANRSRSSSSSPTVDDDVLLLL